MPDQIVRSDSNLTEDEERDKLIEAQILCNEKWRKNRPNAAQVIDKKEEVESEREIVLQLKDTSIAFYASVLSENDYSIMNFNVSKLNDKDAYSKFAHLTNLICKIKPAFIVLTETDQCRESNIEKFKIEQYQGPFFSKNTNKKDTGYGVGLWIRMDIQIDDYEYKGNHFDLVNYKNSISADHEIKRVTLKNGKGINDVYYLIGIYRHQSFTIKKPKGSSQKLDGQDMNVKTKSYEGKSDVSKINFISQMRQIVDEIVSEEDKFILAGDMNIGYCTGNHCKENVNKEYRKILLHFSAKFKKEIEQHIRDPTINKDNLSEMMRFVTKNKEFKKPAEDYVDRMWDAFKLIREDPLNCFIRDFVTDAQKKNAADKYVKDMKANPYYCKVLQHVTEKTREDNIIDHIVSNFAMKSKVIKPHAVTEVIKDIRLSDHNIVLGYWCLPETEDAHINTKTRKRGLEEFSDVTFTSNVSSSTTNSCSNLGSASKRKNLMESSVEEVREKQKADEVIDAEANTRASSPFF